MTTTSNNKIQEFFIPIVKIKPQKDDELIPELTKVPTPDPVHPNPTVAEWITNVKKRNPR